MTPHEQQMWLLAHETMERIEERIDAINRYSQIFKELEEYFHNEEDEDYEDA